MAASEASPMTNTDEIYANIRAVFGRYKAEWLREDLFPLFRRPAYFPELEEPRPTVLVGGRGTGKTTALRCLSYEGLYELQGRDANSMAAAPYVGLYWCIDANRVTAFRGPELESEAWQRMFAHYVNLEIVGQLCRYAMWFEEQTGESVDISDHLLEKVSLSLHLPDARSLEALYEGLETSIVKLEAAVNSVLDGGIPDLSMPSAPIQYMVEALASDRRLQPKTFYVLIDEFENLTEIQQVVLNTLVKHGRQQLVFKLGVKEGGWRTRSTLAQDETLVHPADYDLIDLGDRLSDGAYAQFALEVCNARLSRALQAGGTSVPEIAIDRLFESLTPDEEARLLGVKRRVRGTREELGDHPDLLELASGRTDLELYYAMRRSSGDLASLGAELRSFNEDSNYVENYKTNYRQSLLYTISEHAGRGIQKYYAGWDTLVKVSGGNIRYLVELVERAFAKHAFAQRPIAEPVSARHQTEACIDVGRKYTQEVQSLDPAGANLTYLLLGLGRFFNILARHSQGHQPDTTSFVIGVSEDPATDERVAVLIQKAVMHQVLRRSSATKLTATVDAKEWEYSVHPIYAAFFVIPYQRKRRLRLSAGELLLLTSNVRRGLNAMLKDRRELGSLDDALPDQMSLFEPVYG